MRIKGNTEMDDRWPVWKLSLMLYVFAVGAVAINLFMLGLLGQAIGLPALSPETTVLLSLPLGVPAAWGAGSWARRLMDQAS